MTEEIYCCEQFKQAVKDHIIINEEFINGSWNPPVRYDEWYLSKRDFNQYIDRYEYFTVLEPIKFCPWCSNSKNI